MLIEDVGVYSKVKVKRLVAQRLNQYATPGPRSIQ
jgi:hypothetical protein